MALTLDFRPPWSPSPATAAKFDLRETTCKSTWKHPSNATFTCDRRFLAPWMILGPDGCSPKSHKIAARGHCAVPLPRNAYYCDYSLASYKTLRKCPRPSTFPAPRTPSKLGTSWLAQSFSTYFWLPKKYVVSSSTWLGEL